MKKTVPSLIAVLCIVLALSGWYVYNRANLPERGPGEKTAVMKNASVIHYLNGRPAVAFSAEKAVLSRDGERINSHNVKVRFLSGGSPVSFTCRALLYDPYRQLILADGNVGIKTKTADVSTGTCRFFAANNVISAPKKIGIKTPDGKASAANGIIDLDSGHIKLTKTEMTIFRGK
ncbi:MAG: hypothetical protein ILO36_09320 [Abditibacteriota bacterium]|nr:hypothetical protein [Abditibacteriota bacterium]